MKSIHYLTADMTSFEAGLGHFCNIDRETGCLALEALRAKSDPARQIRPITIEGDTVPPMMEFWPVTDLNGSSVGRISSSAYAQSYNKIIAIGLIDRSHRDVDTQLLVQTPDGIRKAKIRSAFPRRPTKANI